MDTASANEMTTPASYEDSPLPKRNGARGMVPSTWLNREVRIEYVDAAGHPVTTAGTLLDWYPFGPALNLAGARTLLAWDRIAAMELVSD